MVDFVVVDLVMVDVFAFEVVTVNVAAVDIVEVDVVAVDLVVDLDYGTGVESCFAVKPDHNGSLFLMAIISYRSNDTFPLA